MRRALFVLTFLVLAAFGGGRAAADPAVTVVMSGLDNPRGLAFGPEGALYVAEAGRGGSGPCVVLGQTLCYGATGAVTRLWRGTQERIATGYPSIATTVNGIAQAGPNDISFLGRGGAYITIGLQANPTLRGTLIDDEGVVVGAGLGQLVHMSASGEWRDIVDVAAYELAVNPDPRVFDSNPFGLLAEPGVRVVADAGANALLGIAADGEISTVAVMPRVPQARSGDSVPTSVVKGPDGAYYVGELTGAPFVAGAAHVYRIVPGEPPQVFLSGFKSIIDIAFDAAGSLYVLQHATGPTMNTGPGVLFRVDPDGTRTAVLSGLTRPTSVAIGPDGAVYVSNQGIFQGIGEVLRFEP